MGAQGRRTAARRQSQNLQWLWRVQDAPMDCRELSAAEKGRAFYGLAARVMVHRKLARPRCSGLQAWAGVVGTDALLEDLKVKEEGAQCGFGDCQWVKRLAEER
jgi:hypothetical protein